MQLLLFSRRTLKMRVILRLFYGYAALSASRSQALPAPSSMVKLPLPALCLDGSPATYYVSKPAMPGDGSGAGSRKFLVHLQGGGWCQTVSECQERSRTALGSSKHYPPTMDLSTVDSPTAPPGLPNSKRQTGHNAFDRDPAVNPLFHDWTFVYVPYCDGQSFTGDNATTTTASTSATTTEQQTLYFRGKAIREAVVASLKTGLASATDLVVWGCSAGGAATFFHVDWFAAQAPGAKTRGMPDSGWFQDGDYSRDGKPDYGARMRNMYVMANASSSLPAGCGERCLFAQHMFPYIATPTFIMNSKYDASMAPGTYEGAGGAARPYQCPEYKWLAPADACNAKHKLAPSRSNYQRHETTTCRRCSRAPTHATTTNHLAIGRRFEGP